MLLAVWSNTMNSLNPQAVSTQQYRSTETTSKTPLTLQIQTAPLQYKHSHAAAVTLVILCCPFQNQQRQFIHISTQKMLHDTMKTWTAYQLSTGIQVKLYKVHKLFLKRRIHDKHHLLATQNIPSCLKRDKPSAHRQVNQPDQLWNKCNIHGQHKSTNLINCEINKCSIHGQHR